MQIQGHDIGVCSWTLRPKNMAELIDTVRSVGLQHIQLALGNFLDMEDAERDAELDQLRASGLVITAGMMGFPGEDYSSISSIRRTGGFVPDELWDQRRSLMERGGRLAQTLGLDKVSTHIGFVPPSSQPAYKTMVERVGEVAARFADLGLVLLLETGQESAPELLQFLNDLPVRNVAANFDPANMILYGAGDPIDAIRILGRHIGHVHVKDAILSDRPGQEWGRDVPFGSGQVNPRRFLSALTSAGYTGPLIIEREAGSARIEDVRAAITALQNASEMTV